MTTAQIEPLSTNFLDTLAARHSLPGTYVVVEGGNGTGKTTLMPMLADAIRAATSRELVLVAEPGGTPFGLQMRELLFSESLPADPMIELLLMSAARRTLIEQVVRPALARGAIVLSDRSFLSSFVFQGAGGVPTAALESITIAVTAGIVPDCSVVLTVTEETARERTTRRGDYTERFEALEMARHAEIRSRYASFAAAMPNCLVISADGKPEQTLASAMRALHPVILSAAVTAPESSAPKSGTRVGAGKVAHAPIAGRSAL